MILQTPPEDQGQIMETSYGWNEGFLYRRSVDASDGSVIWEVADEEDSDQLPEGWQAVNGSPNIHTWTLCDHAPESDK